VLPHHSIRLRFEHANAALKLKSDLNLVAAIQECSSFVKNWQSKKPVTDLTRLVLHRLGFVVFDTANFHHKAALQSLAAASAAYEAWKKGGSKGDWMDALTEGSKLDAKYLRSHSTAIQTGCKRFEIYCLRHSALAMLAESGCDAFTLARIAGHSSITITQRYCHPQADAIERAFEKLSGGHKIGHSPELPSNTDSGQAIVNVVGTSIF
jgi:hypothetical protein